MPDHPDLTTDNIKNIVSYIKSESKLANGAKKSVTKTLSKKPGSLLWSITDDYWLLSGLLASFLLLIGTLIFAVKVNALKKRILSGKRTNM